MCYLKGKGLCPLYLESLLGQWGDTLFLGQNPR